MWADTHEQGCPYRSLHLQKTSFSNLLEQKIYNIHVNFDSLKWARETFSASSLTPRLHNLELEEAGNLSRREKVK